MEEDDVHDDGGEDGERQRDEEPANSSNSSRHLQHLEQRKNVPGGEEGPGEGPGRERRWRLGDEVEEAVETEDGKDQTEKDAGRRE